MALQASNLAFAAPLPAVVAPSVRHAEHRFAPTGATSERSTGFSERLLVAVCAGVAAAGAGLRQRGGARRQPRKAVVRQAGALADCPYTLYGTKDVRVAEERKTLEVAECPLEVHMPEELKGNIEGQKAYFAKNLPKIYKDLKIHGAIVFRGFELSREAAGFQQVGEALELERCEDPLHSVAARDAVNKEAGVYEAVNKPSRRKFYVGMHNEMVGNRAPGAAIFVCFKAAEEGGEFLIADGRQMFRELDEEWLTEMYDKEVRYSTAEFPMGFLESLPGFLSSALEPVAYGALKQALKMKVDFETELVWEKSEYDGSKILQVRAMPQVPIVRHPYTGEPAWWGSMHSHAEYLRSEREKVFGEEGFENTTGASRINKTGRSYPEGSQGHQDARGRHGVVGQLPGDARSLPVRGHPQARGHLVQVPGLLQGRSVDTKAFLKVDEEGSELQSGGFIGENFLYRDPKSGAALPLTVQFDTLGLLEEELRRRCENCTVNIFPGAEANKLLSSERSGSANRTTSERVPIKTVQFHGRPGKKPAPSWNPWLRRIFRLFSSRA